MGEDFVKRRNRKSDIANLTINISQAIALAGFIWAAATQYQKLIYKLESTASLIGETKSDIGELAVRVINLEKQMENRNGN